MSREREFGSEARKRQKTHALFQLQLNKCENIPEKDKLLIRAHLVDGKTNIINIFQGFNAYKCYKRLEGQLNEYLQSYREQKKVQPQKNMKQNGFLLKSPRYQKISTRQQRQGSIPQQSFPRRRSLVLDVGLLKQESQLRNALSPCNMKSKMSNDDNIHIINTARTGQSLKKLTKVYSISKFNSQNNKNHQKYVPPFCQQQINHPNFMKLFLMNKIKHQKQIKKIRKDIQHQKQNHNNQNNDQSIFSFQIYSKNPQKDRDNIESRQIIKQVVKVEQKYAKQQNNGVFYKRIRKVIDSQYQ